MSAITTIREDNTIDQKTPLLEGVFHEMAYYYGTQINLTLLCYGLILDYILNQFSRPVSLTLI